jgi:protein involved in polysaccharide export with SLBB domain
MPYSCGPGKNESYRNIELIRNNKVYTKVDLYKFLVNGDQSENVGLKDNDVIRIPAYKRVTIEGQVKRPGIFEMKPGESFSDLLSFASGFTEFAYTASVNKRNCRKPLEFKVQDIPLNSKVTNRFLATFRVTKRPNRIDWAV